LRLATGCVGAGVGAALLVPAGRLALGVAGRRTVTTAAEPIDVLAADQVGPRPLAVTLRADVVRDGWAATRDVPLGIAYVRRDEAGAIRALSGVCPHQGCTIGLAAGGDRFVCPCHDSFFALDGERLEGPSERGLDELPVTVEGGRVKVQWVRYRLGTPTREPA
jgi:Rieske Fe-S protein